MLSNERRAFLPLGHLKGEFEKIRLPEPPSCCIDQPVGREYFPHLVLRAWSLALTRTLVWVPNSIERDTSIVRNSGPIRISYFALQSFRMSDGSEATRCVTENREM